MATEASERLEIDVELRERDSSRVAWVRVGGELDLSNAEELGAALRSPACAESDAVVLDLRRLGFMDSSGIRVVLMLAEERKSALRTLVRPGGPIAKLFEIVDVAEQLNVVGDEEEAAPPGARVDGAD